MLQKSRHYKFARNKPAAAWCLDLEHHPSRHAIGPPTSGCISPPCRRQAEVLFMLKIVIKLILKIVLGLVMKIFLTIVLLQRVLKLIISHENNHES